MITPDFDAAAAFAAAEMALRVLDEADAWDEGLVRGACDWLAAVAPAEGGAAFVEGTLSGRPHAPWWVPEEGHPASLIATGMIAGTLHARGVSHPWLDGATEVMWNGSAHSPKRAGTRCSACSGSSSTCPTGTGTARPSCGSA